MESKVCTKCGLDKPLSEYSLQKAAPSEIKRGVDPKRIRYRSDCKKCQYARNRKYFKEKYYPEHREEIIESVILSRKEKPHQNLNPFANPTD